MRPSPTRSLWSLALLAACDGVNAPPPAEVRVTAITAVALAGTVGAAVEPAPAVRVTDELDRPLGGVAVTFRPAEGSGTVPRATVTSGADGTAAVGTWTLGPRMGDHTLTAGAGGQADVVFTATAAAGPPAEVEPVSGNDQFAGVGARLDSPLLVRVTDAFGNPLTGVAVEFTVVTGGGSIAGAATVTDAEGYAVSGLWTLGAEGGEQQVRVVAGALETTFRAVAAPPPAPLEGRIAFESWAEPDVDIAIANADGSGVRRLHDPWMELQPVWSPDGGRLAVTHDSQSDEAVSLYTVTTSGGRSRVTEGPIDGDPAWSPDGSKIAFSTLRDGSAQIAALDVATGAVTVLVDERGYDGQPTWSPDGRRLAFVSDYAAFDFVFDIYLANADGTGRRQLTHGFRDAPDGLEYFLHPAWSPDGSLIAFVHGGVIRGRHMRFNVGLMSPEGVVLTMLAWAGDIPWDEVLDPGSLSWSPDGSGIAYSFVDCDLVTAQGCSRARSVKYVSLDGSRESTIVADARNPSWIR